jgi:5-methyltetrahydrofolate--homocysteine methyltransferase
MPNESNFSPLTQAVIDGKPDEVAAMVSAAIAAQREPQSLLDELIIGIREVGDRFGRGEYYLPDLMIGAKAMKSGMTCLQPELTKASASGDGQPGRGKVLLGTVKGDLHDIGKSLVGLLLEVNGYEVRDLGVDVSVEQFIAEANRLQPDVVGMSSLLTTTAAEMQKIIETLTQAGLRQKCFFIIGGAATTSAYAEGIHADGWAENAADAVKLVAGLLASRGSQP